MAKRKKPLSPDQAASLGAAGGIGLSAATTLGSAYRAFKKIREQTSKHVDRVHTRKRPFTAAGRTYAAAEKLISRASKKLHRLNTFGMPALTIAGALAGHEIQRHRLAKDKTKHAMYAGFSDELEKIALSPPQIAALAGLSVFGGSAVGTLIAAGSKGRERMKKEVRDPRLYSNLRGAVSGESREERVKAHKKLPKSKGSVLHAMKTGFRRKKE